VHDLFAANFAIERTLDAFNLTPEAAHARQQLMFFTDRVSHAPYGRFRRRRQRAIWVTNGPTIGALL